MATRLQAAGEQVALLAMMDAYPSVPDGRRHDLPTEHEAAAAVLESLGHQTVDLAGVADLQVLARVFVRNSVAQTVHRPGTFDGPVLFFAAALGRDSTWPVPADWRPYVTGDIDLHELQCVHGAMTRPEVLAQIGSVLASRIRGPDDKNSVEENEDSTLSGVS
jgi:thioesterase domain-containing protein